ncbi:hypothetical protein ABZ883_05890 [Streptomyces sp. NPDC046977]|uniref:hypothetical protein n=1 Tax=Streptomyces sp. NPDC046977 TaxID=3154703 RepID=UPI0033C81B87
MHGEGNGRDARSRVWGGLAVVAVGSFIAGDAVHRTRVVVEWATTWWPWALLLIAALNLFRSVSRTGSLIGPGLLTAVALTGLGVARGVAAHTVLNAVLPAALIVAGAILTLSVHSREQQDAWVCAFTTGHVVAPDEIGERTAHPLLTARALAGDLRVDLTASRIDGIVTVHATVVFGQVRLTVPRTWPVKVHAPGSVLTRITDSGPRHEIETGSPAGVVTLHVLGACGAISVLRT